MSISLPLIEWSTAGLPVIDTVLVLHTAQVERRYVVGQPAPWPFPPMGEIQARNHAKCAQLARQIAQQRQQQRLNEALEASGWVS